MSRWARGVLLAAAGGLAGCAGMYVPQGPKHQPVGTPEAPSACPTEKAAAVSSREALLDPSGVEPGARETAARAILAQATCESAAVSGTTLEPGGRKTMLGALEKLRQLYHVAVALHEEVASYGLGARSVDAAARAAVFADATAARVRTMDLPGVVTEPDGRAPLRMDQEAFVSAAAADVGRLVARALELASLEDDVSDPALPRAVATACKLLRRRDPGSWAQQPICPGSSASQGRAAPVPGATQVPAPTDGSGAASPPVPPGP